MCYRSLAWVCAPMRCACECANAHRRTQQTRPRTKAMRPLARWQRQRASERASGKQPAGCTHSGRFFCAHSLARKAAPLAADKSIRLLLCARLGQFVSPTRPLGALKAALARTLVQCEAFAFARPLRASGAAANKPQDSPASAFEWPQVQPAQVRRTNERI